MNAQQMEAPILISQPEAARLLGGIDRTTIWRMVKHGDLTRVTIGSRSLITRASVEPFRPVTGEAPLTR
jgi:excisionase family DNA binding protein